MTLTAGSATPVGAGSATPVGAGSATPVGAGPATPVAAGLATPVAAGSATPVGAGPTTPLRRRDAEANRRRILAAAGEAFGSEGLGVSMVEIARRAGVGNATIHRHYASKQQLLDELFEEWFARRRAAAEQALEDPDVWRGLVRFLDDALADSAAHRAAGDLYALRTKGRERLRTVLDRLLERARADGAVRADMTTQDLIALVLGVGRTIEITGDVAPDQWRRHLAIVLAGMRPSDDPLPGRAIGAASLDEAILRWAQPFVGSRKSRATLCAGDEGLVSGDVRSKE
jgi:AcrR family transcriptional regulator